MSPPPMGGSPFRGIVSDFLSLIWHLMCRNAELMSMYFWSPAKMSNEIAPVLDTAFFGWNFAIFVAV